MKMVSLGCEMIVGVLVIIISSAAGYLIGAAQQKDDLAFMDERMIDYERQTTQLRSMITEKANALQNIQDVLHGLVDNADSKQKAD